MSRDELIASLLGKSSPKPAATIIDGTTYYVRVMTAYDADRTRKQLEGLKKDDGCETGRLLAVVLCDESGVLLFDVNDAEAVLALSKLPPRLQTRLITAANEAQGNDSGNA